MKELGGDVRAYRQQRATDSQRTVSEVYSRLRVTAMAKLLPQYNVIPGFALDLSTSKSNGERWDFSKLHVSSEHA